MNSRLALVLGLGLMSLSSACAAPNHIDWVPCKQNGTQPFTCGMLNVPLDYTDAESNTTLKLEMVRLRALKQPSKGSILVNPGGPGESGRDFIAGLAGQIVMIATGGEFDLIGFDPRYVLAPRSSNF